MIHVALLLGCAVVLYLACEWFVNAVEWFGVQLDVGPVAVGTILAAVGTALPESVVTLVAVTGSGEHGADIGVGAALGGPLVVATVAYATVGATLMARRWSARRPSRAVRASRTAGAAAPVPGEPAEATGPAGGLTGVLAPEASERLARDQTWFLVIFVVKAGLGLVAFAFKPWLGLLFFVAYAVYFWRELRGGGAASAVDLEPLKLQPRRAVPSRLAVLAQTGVTLVVIFVASQVFVGQLEWAGPAMGLPPVVVALLLSPIATELPETMNALIWVRQGKTNLALANISGAMMIQATVPTAFGLFFTPWILDESLLLSAGATFLAVGAMFLTFRRGVISRVFLASMAGLYGLFAVALLVLHLR